VAAQVGAPMRTFYSGSKFALDGFGKALTGELSHHNISVLQCYPAYVQTNISRNALFGKAEKFGKTDSNIENGIPVDLACEDLIKAIYVKRSWITLGSAYYSILPKIQVFLGENLAKKVMQNNYKQ
jgi:short-subunit dehydrogenase